MKAFLSHSSANKDYVGKVFDYLSAARAHYDSVTFDSFQRSYEAIHAAMKDSDVFVFFASPESLASPWVKEEIRIAGDPATVGKHLERIVVLIGAKRDLLPPELRQCTAISYSDPGLVARKIEDLLIQLHSRTVPSRPFIGREDDLKSVGGGITPVGSKAPEFILISGISGAGRRTLVARAVRDNYPFITQTLRTVPVSKGVSVVDLYFSTKSIAGSLINNSDKTIEDIQVYAALFDETNSLYAISSGSLDYSSLKPNEDSPFKIDIYSSDKPQLDHFMLLVSGAPAQTGNS